MFESNYEDETQLIQQNMSDFAAVYIFVVDPRRREDALRLMTSVEQPALALHVDDLTPEGVSQTLSFISSYDDSDDMAAKYGFAAYSSRKIGKDYRFTTLSPDTKRRIFAKTVLRLKRLLKNNGKSISFC